MCVLDELPRYDLRVQTLRASLRVHAAGLAILLFLTLAFAVLTSKDVYARIFFGTLFLGITGVLLVVYRKENVLAENHLVASGTVTQFKKGGRGGIHIKYQFVAFDGRPYRGESDWGTKTVQVGGDASAV
jgi:hypothetical protein